MIDFFDLKAQNKEIETRINKRIQSVISHGKFILGPEVYQLEEKLSDYSGAEHCITCANGTDALQIALMSLDIGPGDEVIIPGFSYIAAAEVVALLRAKPIYVDVCKLTYNLTLAGIKEAITEKTKAIISVSLYGVPAQFDEINKLALENGITVIEDAAQSFGSTYKEKKSCNLSTIGCTSFFPTKPLGCYGDGGAVFTKDPQLAEVIRQISRHGQAARYEHVRLGVNSRLDTIQAAILLEKIEILDYEIKQRSINAELYSQNLDQAVVQIPTEPHFTKSAWGQYTIQIQNRDEVQKQLQEAGIPSTVHYPKPLSCQQAYLNPTVILPNAKQLSQTVLSLPIHAYLSRWEIEHICNKINTL